MKFVKTSVSLQIILLIGATIAFAYILNEATPESFMENERNNKFDKLSLAKILAGIGETIFAIIPSASAVTTEDISAGAYTCLKTLEGKTCQEFTASECATKCAEVCIPSRREDISACIIGTCYDLVEGICQPGSPKGTCEIDGGQWINDPNGNDLLCKRGCCILGDQTSFTTSQACTNGASRLGIKQTFRADIATEIGCWALSKTQEEGACLFEFGEKNQCKFGTKAQCATQGGEFYANTLCSHPDLGTSCVRQATTNCATGKDEIYWFDSCGNRENIYEGSLQNQKEHGFNEGLVLTKDKACSLQSGTNPFANQKSCGNCNYLLGSTCGARTSVERLSDSAQNVVCKDLSCTDSNGKRRAQGESWCLYQGAIGVDSKNRATDTVGSRHFRQTCLNGEVRTDPCADYRNEICVEAKTPLPSGQTFSSAACRINLWQQCINVNNEKDVDMRAKKCQEQPDCFIKKVDIGKQYKFNVCAPKYPPGFLLEDETGRGEGAEAVCSMASQKCTVVYVKGLGGWSCKQNCECRKTVFTEKLNDLCISLGDCGTKINYAGELTENIAIKKTKNLTNAYIQGLEVYDKPVPNKIADPEVEKLYGALGIPDFLGQGNFTDPSAAIGQMGSMAGMMGTVAVLGAYAGGLALGLSAPAGLSGFAAIKSVGLSAVGSTLGPGAAAAGGALAGAAAGFAVVSLLLQFTGVGRGLPPAVSYGLMAAGAAAGAVIGLNAVAGTAAASFSSLSSLAVAAAFAWVAIIAIVVVIIIFAILGIGKIKKVKVEFTCKPWQPPVGGEKCGECGKNGLPCSPYACQSLGQTCQLINEYSSEESCVDVGRDDVSPPRLKPLQGVLPAEHSYSTISELGYSIVTPSTCLQPFTLLSFGVASDEPARCEANPVNEISLLDLAQGEERINESITDGMFMSSLYIKNHTIILSVPSLEALGAAGYDPNATAQFGLSFSCEDKRGNKPLKPYIINFCVGRGVDLTPARITFTQPPNPVIVSFDTTEKNVSLYASEPAECKYDLFDKPYDLMSSSLNCSSDVEERTLFGWKCDATLPIAGNESEYKIRCLDQPWLSGTENESQRNANVESYLLKLQKTSSALRIDSITPSNNTQLSFAVSPASVKVEVKTSGGYDGSAQCSYTWGNVIIPFKDTLTNKHVQVFQTLDAGSYNLPIRCTDVAGNTVERTASFRVALDIQAPKITRVYASDGELIVITDEPSTCMSNANECFFADVNGTNLIGDSFVHRGFVDYKAQYIRCVDLLGNGREDSCQIKVQQTASGILTQEL